MTLVLGLAGCGSASSGSTSSSSPPGQPSGQSPSATPAPTGPSLDGPSVIPPATTGSAAPTAAAAPAVPGPHLAVDTANGFSVSLPASFFAIDASSTVAGLVKAGAPDGDGLAPALAQLRKMLSDTETVLAVDFSSVSERYVDYVDVNVSSSKGATPGSIVDDDKFAVQYLAQFKASETSHESLTVAGGPALRVDYTLPQSGFTVVGTQIYLIHGNELFAVTINMQDRTHNAATVNALIRGLRFS